MVRRGVAAVAVAAALAGLPACAAVTDSRTTPADPRACPGPVLSVTVSVSQWSDAVRTLGGACTSVTTVLDSAVLDPHDHELTTGDIAALAGADLVVVNGASYDTWAESAATRLSPRPAVLSIAAAAAEDDGGHDDGTHGAGREHTDPHLWGDPGIVSRASAALTARLSELSPAAAGYFRERAQVWQQQLQPYLAEVDDLRHALAGRSYLASEAMFDRTAGALGLRDATPAAYRSIISNEGEPGPGDVVAFRSALSGARVAVLVYNTQTEGSLPEQLRAAARSAGVPVVEVSESPPDAGSSFVDWQLGQLHRLAAAYGVTP